MSLFALRVMSAAVNHCFLPQFLIRRWFTFSHVFVIANLKYLWAIDGFLMGLAVYCVIFTCLVLILPGDQICDENEPVSADIRWMFTSFVRHCKVSIGLP